MLMRQFAEAARLVANDDCPIAHLQRATQELRAPVTAQPPADGDVRVVLRRYPVHVEAQGSSDIVSEDGQQWQRTGRLRPVRGAVVHSSQPVLQRRSPVADDGDAGG